MVHKELLSVINSVYSRRHLAAAAGFLSDSVKNIICPVKLIMQVNFSEKADIGRKKLKFKEKERPEEKSI